MFVLRMQGGENRFNGEAIAARNAALDEAETTEGPKALVTTGTGKFYSNGLDLDYMQSDAPGGPQQYLAEGFFNGLLARLRAARGFPPTRCITALHAGSADLGNIGRQRDNAPKRCVQRF
ncbi:MAG: hypothetical protein QF570_05835 [Myxococcota bacterium]|nr:hypothetical protein [Myxococcota bacterium]